MGDPTGWKRRMQAYVDARHEELSQLEAELVGARATLDEHDAAVRDRAADLDSAARKLAAEEATLCSPRAPAPRLTTRARVVLLVRVFSQPAKPGLVVEILSGYDKQALLRRPIAERHE